MVASGTEDSSQNGGRTSDPRQTILDKEEKKSLIIYLDIDSTPTG